MGDSSPIEMDSGAGENKARTKIELDTESHVLGTTVKLSDGTDGRVFSRNGRNKEKQFIYSCHLCGVAVLPGERVLQTHIAGRKHQSRLNMPVIDAEQFRNSSTPKAAKIQMQIAPGEPVPPGMENEVKPVAELQTTIDKFKHGPMAGLEYIMELTTPGKKEPSYHCILCDKKGDPRTVVVHITSHMHRIKFLEKHYPTVVNELAPYRLQRGSNKEIINRVIQTVCEAIEDHHGRLTPTVHDSADYARNKMKYLQEVIFEKHFDERTGPKFVEVIDKKMLQDQLAAATGAKAAPAAEPKRDPSPPIVQAPQKKTRPARADRKSLDSISSSDSVQSISSEDSTKAVQPTAVTGRYGDSTLVPRTRPAGLPVPRGSNRTRSPLPFRRSPMRRSPVRRGGSPFHHRSPVRNRYDRRSPPPRRRSPPPRRRSRSPVRRRSPVRSDRSPLRFNDRRSTSPGSKKNKPTLPTPKQLSLQASEIAHERYKWEKYRCSLEIAVTLIDKAFKEHEKNPEKHPLYPEEWKTFWNRRYKELQTEKKDPSKHDFKPEWIVFWTKRMKELRDDEIEQKKVEIRKKLNLPDEGAEKTAELKEQYIVKVNKKKRPLAVEPIESSDDDRLSIKSRESSKIRSTRAKKSKSPISDDDFDERSRHSSSRAYSRERERERERERDRERQWEWEKERGRHRPLPVHVQTDQNYDEWAKNYYGPNKKIFVRKEFDNDSTGPLNFVAVCRLLTALEEYLGSLGPRTIDLLSKALALEKIKANSADELLLNEDNCMFLETAKEKLKGHLMADMVEPQKIAAVKKAIKNIASLIHEASKKERPAPIPERQPTPPPTSAPATTDGGVDKAAIAQKLAAALVAQGKTDFTGEELEQLINVYVAMAEASKEKEKPVTTSSFLTDVAPSKSTTERKPETASQREETSYPKETTENTDGNALEGLTDSDLQTLLQNFKDLSNEEQLHLISHLKKLERTDPLRVEKLRRYVNLDDKPSTSGRQTRDQYLDEEDDRNYDDDDPVYDDGQNFEEDPQDFAISKPLNAGSQNKPLVSGSYDDNSSDPYLQKKLIDSDEEDDYSYDDVVRAASKNVNVSKPSTNSTSSSRRADLGGENNDGASNFSRTSNERSSQLDTQHIIANLMGSLPKPGAAQATSNYSNPISTIGQSVDTRQNANFFDSNSQHSNSSFGGSYPSKAQAAPNGSGVFQAQGKPQYAPIQTANSTLNNMPYYYQQQQMRAQQMQQQQMHPQQQQQQMHPQQQQQQMHPHQQAPMGFGGQFGGQPQQGAYMWQQQNQQSSGSYQYDNNFY